VYNGENISDQYPKYHGRMQEEIQKTLSINISSRSDTGN
jgi:hypothetical protein